MNSLRPIAIYLPQFHPIPENNAWWGKGFTEWTNVAKAKPLFDDHYQPHLPADLGFYDLRLSEARLAQEALAKKYGIHGFCYYHYWFNGKRLLNEPMDRKLNNKKEDLPFMLCWANENWTRRWDGQDREVLMQQDYSEEDDRQHFKELERHFRDERYILVDGKPVFVVYRTQLFPNILKTVSIWREEATKAGLKGIYLITVESMGKRVDPKDIGFDAAMEFQPDFNNMPTRILGSKWSRLLSKLKIREFPFISNSVYDYQAMATTMLAKPTVDYKLYYGVTPMWDNAARRKKDALIIVNSTPAKYKEWLRAIIKRFNPFSKEENFVFINAWNEWAEGNHLEPCQKWGLQYLEATKEAIDNA